MMQLQISDCRLQNGRHHTPAGCKSSICNLQFAILCILQSAILSGCAGYQIGNRALYRPDLRTVHVPVIQSDSYRRYLGERLTEAIVKEIELRTPYKVVGPDAAD